MYEETNPSYNGESSSDKKEMPKYGYYNISGGKKPRQKFEPDKDSKLKRKSSAGKIGVVLGYGALFGLAASIIFCVSTAMIGTLHLSDQTTESTSQIVSSSAEAESTAEEAAAADTSAEDGDGGSEVSSQGTVAEVAASSMSSVVAITTVSVQEIQDFFGSRYQYKSSGSGSGIIVGENEEELLIATNNHVVEGATTLSVFFYEADSAENAVEGTIKGTDATNDLAVVAVRIEDIPEEIYNTVSIARIGDSDNLVVGEQVVAIGNALGYGQSVTSGWISALNRDISTESESVSGLIQTDAAINPGNSGGALLNMNGELIGINSAKFADSAVEGMGYAIPISKALPILEELMSRETRELVTENKAYLGVSVMEITSEAMEMYNLPAGAFVKEVVSGSSAEEYGIMKGDIIVEFDGQTVTGADELTDLLEYYSAGEQVEIVIERSYEGVYEEQTITVTLGGTEY